MPRNFWFIIIFITARLLWAQEPPIAAYDSLFKKSVEQMGYSGKASLQTARAYLKLAAEHKDSLEMAYALDNIGSAFYTLNELDSALQYYKVGYAYFRNNQDSIGLSKALENIGICYAYQGNIEGAVRAYRKAYRIDTALKDIEAEHYLLSNLSSLYLMQENYQEAEAVLERFLEISLPDTAFHFHLPYIYLDLAELLLHQEKYQAAEDTLLKAKSLLDSVYDIGSYAMVYSGLGEVLHQRGQYDSALVYYRKAIHLDSLLGDPFLIAYDLEYMARSLHKKGSRKEAEQLLLQAKSVADTEGVLGLSRDIYKALALFYASQNQYDKAWDYQNQHYEYVDTIRRKNAQTVMLELEAETAEKRLQDSANRAMIQEQKLQRQKRWILFSLLVLLAGLAIIYMQYRLRRKTSRSNQLLKKRNKEIADQQWVLDQQARDLERTNEKLQKLNDSKDRLFSVLAHDLRQPFNQILSVIDLLENEPVDEGDQQRLFLELKASVQSTNDLVNNMLIWSKAQFAGISINKKAINLEAMVKRQLLQFSTAIEKKNITVAVAVEEGLKVHFDLDHLAVILRNLLHNALKYSKLGTRIEVVSKAYDEKFIALEISDEGVGMSDEQIDRVLHNFKTESSLGTLKEPGTGLGLIITKEFLQENGGALELESTPGKGSVFRLLLPQYLPAPRQVS